MLRFIVKHSLIFGATAATVIIALAVGLIFNAWQAGPLPEKGCWEVTDVSGHVSRFTTAPQYDLQVHGIKFEKDGHAGWIFPARVDEDLVCAGVTP